jgi:hypothetical protein
MGEYRRIDKIEIQKRSLIQFELAIKKEKNTSMNYELHT